MKREYLAPKVTTFDEEKFNPHADDLIVVIPPSPPRDGDGDGGPKPG